VEHERKDTTLISRSRFIEICRASYEECKDFWEVEPEAEMPETFEISGSTSQLSSIESVTFIASIEEQLSIEGIEVSFIDHFTDIDNSSINIQSMYNILEQCIA